MGYLGESLLAVNTRFQKDWQMTSEGDLAVGEKTQDPNMRLPRTQKSCLERTRTFSLSGTEPTRQCTW